MSRIGKKIISIPSGVDVKVSEGAICVKGPKGELTQDVKGGIKAELSDNALNVIRLDDSKTQKSLHGLYRSLISNMVVGVSEGYKLDLELVGVGYKATCSNNVLDLSLGYSHNIVFALPAEVKGTAVTEKGKNPIVTLESIDKQLVGQVAAKLRSLRKIEPYKGKGIRFVGEQIIRKAGKTAAK